MTLKESRNKPGKAKFPATRNATQAIFPFVKTPLRTFPINKNYKVSYTLETLCIHVQHGIRVCLSPIRFIVGFYVLFRRKLIELD